MIQIINKLVKPLSRQHKGNINSQLEPHVCTYDVHRSEKALFVLPFQLITYVSAILMITGFATWLIWDQYTVIQAVALIHLFFAPFYLPGLYLYNKYLQAEQGTCLEIDTKHGFIQYLHRERKENILFHPQQIDRLVMHASMMLPYRLDYLTIHLKGGQQVHISGLIAEPEEILRHIRRPFQVRKRWFNPFPRR
ncbi:MAG: hypothetical protein AAFR61_04555 [Bacteroidota bacterium]